jgi:hypothetical protein
MTRASANIEAELAYLVPTEGRAEHRIYPPNSGVELVRPQQVYQTMTINDARNRPAYTAHTGFKNPLAPATAIPRESIELRTLVIFA